MILIIGLGNPGEKYKQTRHNIGKTIVKNFGKNFEFNKFKQDKKNKAKTTSQKNIILAIPSTYMNESGQTARLLENYFLKEPKSSIWIIHDEIDLPLGKIKISINRSSAGHRGVESIIKQVKSKEIVRFRIGIGKNENIASEKYVLKRFSKDEEETKQKIIKIAQQAIDYAIKNGVSKAMNKYN
ncbi:aminoacyl-tRNA hydrolase [Patescibacteria group bacterium]|nr:aminoacyl-tRNA hydrolase [Patescibacteria group bacterium]